MSRYHTIAVKRVELVTIFPPVPRPKPEILNIAQDCPKIGTSSPGVKMVGNS